MPNGDGLELLREIYQRKIHPRVVALTGGEDTGGPAMLHVARLMGAEYTIKKPFKPEQMLQLVGGMIGANVSIIGVLPTDHGGSRILLKPT